MENEPTNLVETIEVPVDSVYNPKITDLQRVFNGQASLVEIIAIAAVMIPSCFALLAKLDTEKIRKDVSRVVDLGRVDSLRKQNEIENLMGHLMGVTLCDRVIIGIFSEDGKFLTIPYEVTNIGYAPISDGKTRISTSNITADLELVVGDKFTRVNRNNETISSACRQYLESVNLIALDSRKIVSPSNQVVGVIQLHYMRIPTEWTANANASTQVETIFNRLRYDLSAK